MNSIIAELISKDYLTSTQLPENDGSNNVVDTEAELPEEDLLE